MQEVMYTIHIEPCEEGGFVAHFPALPGCQTQAETVEEVIAMAKDALAGYLESIQDHGDPIPQETLPSNFVGFDFPVRASLVR